MGTLIVTGGAGFIGSAFVRTTLAGTDDRIVVFDKLTYAGHLASLAEVRQHPRFTFVQGDIAEREQVRKLFAEAKPTAVVNFAAESHVDRSIDAPGEFLRTNVTGTYELLEACRAAGSVRYLHVSTDEVYGSIESGAFSETSPYAPNSPYAASKAAADHLVRAWHQTYGVPTLLTNCSNNYGPRQFPEKLIPLTLLNALDGKPLPIYGDGLNVRDWLYVEDHCDALLRVLQNARPGTSYNIGGGAERTNLQVVDALCVELEKQRPGRYAELKKFVPDRPGHDRRYAIDASLIRRELGWQPRHDFASGVAATVTWYLQNPEWCRTVQSQDSRDRRGLSR